MMTDTVCADSFVMRAMSDLGEAAMLAHKRQHQALVMRRACRFGWCPS